MGKSEFRSLPFNEDAEKGVLSSLMLCPEEGLSYCAERALTADCFYRGQHRVIYSALMDMWNESKPIDMITLSSYLATKDQVGSAGGIAYVSEVATYLPTAANLTHYTEILVAKWVSRQTVIVCTEQVQKAYEDNDPFGTLDETERRVLGIRGQLTDPKTYDAHTVAMEAMEQIERVYRSPGQITGIATGFADIDRMTNGLKDGELIVLAGRPSHGKTALAMNIAEFIAVSLQLPVAIFSLEMSRQQLMTRAICSKAKVNLFRTLQGYLGERDFPRITIAAGKLAEAQMWIDDEGGITIQEVRARARRMKAKYGIRVMFVDYLQLIGSNTERAKQNRAQEIAEVSGGLKSIARELNIPVVVLAQIGRDFEKRQIVRPRLSDLRESGAIEQDADMVGFIVREELLLETEEDRLEAEGRAELMIAKQRNGPIGDVPLTFLKEYVSFETRCSDELPI